eukprot:g12218.t1
MRQSLSVLSDESEEQPGHGSTATATIFNLVNTIIGAGSLTIPYAMSKAGWCGGLVVLLFAGVFSVLGFMLLIRSSSLTGLFSYKDLADRAFGPWGGLTDRQEIKVLWPFSLAISVVCVCLAMLSDNIGVVLGFNGSVFGVTLVYIVPSIIFLRLDTLRGDTPSQTAARRSDFCTWMITRLRFSTILAGHTHHPESGLSCACRPGWPLCSDSPWGSQECLRTHGCWHDQPDEDTPGRTIGSTLAIHLCLCQRG